MLNVQAGVILIQLRQFRHHPAACPQFGNLAKVCRQNYKILRKFFITAIERIVQIADPVFRFTGQIGASDRLDEQDIACQQILIVYNKRGAPDRMTGRIYRLNPDGRRSYGNITAFLKFLISEGDFCCIFRRQPIRGASLFREFASAGNVVSMQMRIKRMFDHRSLFFRKLFKYIRHPKGIDHGSFPLGYDHVRQAAFTNPDKLIQRAAIFQFTNFHWFQMFAPSFHTAFQIVHIRPAGLYNLLGNKLGRTLFCTYNEQFFAIRNLIQSFVYTIQKIKVGDIDDIHALAFNFPIIKITFVTHIQNKQFFFSQNDSSQFFGIHDFYIWCCIHV